MMRDWNNYHKRLLATIGDIASSAPARFAVMGRLVTLV